jgi:hypothetical protein
MELTEYMEVKKFGFEQNFRYWWSSIAYTTWMNSRAESWYRYETCTHWGGLSNLDEAQHHYFKEETEESIPLG